jgi:hypothetical protein
MAAFLEGEVRYAALKSFAPEDAVRLGKELEDVCLARYRHFAYLAGAPDGQNRDADSSDT